MGCYEMPLDYVLHAAGAKGGLKTRVLRPVYSHSLTVTRRPAAGTAEAQGWGYTHARHSLAGISITIALAGFYRKGSARNSI